MRSIALAFVATFISLSQVYAQSQPLAFSVGVKVAETPQLSLHVFPTERFELALSGYTNDESCGVLCNAYGSVSALVRLTSQEPLSLRLGANYSHSESARLENTDFMGQQGNSFTPWRWAGPVLGFDYMLNDRLTAFADLTIGIDLDIYTVAMTNTGVGLVYRVKKQ